MSEALRQPNRLDEAEKSGQEALRRNPKFPGAFLALSDVAGSKGDYRTEIQNLEAYLRLQPNGPGSEQARQMREAARRALANSHPRD